MLVTLDAMKSYLGISETTYDDFLTSQINLISSTIENYCGRKLNNASYTQTFYFSDFAGDKVLNLFHFPIVSITTVKEIVDTDPITEVPVESTEYRIKKSEASLKRVYYGIPTNWFLNLDTLGKVEVVYNARYVEIPLEIQSVVFSLVAERYNKHTSGISIDFGNDVQRVSIPGTISIDFDYSLQANDRNNAFGMIIGNYANVLDYYRSERTVTGEIKENYVD